MVFFKNSAKKLSPAQAKLVERMFNYAYDGGLEPIGSEVRTMRKLRELNLVTQEGKGRNNYKYELVYSKFECVERLRFGVFYDLR